MNCPQCNFNIPNIQIPTFGVDLSSTKGTDKSITVYKKKKLVFEIGEGTSKKVFTVIEPTNKKRDEYIDLTTEMAKQETEKRSAILAVNSKIGVFSYPEDGIAFAATPQEVAEFEKNMAEEMQKIEQMPTPSNRTAVEFFLGPLTDEFWETEMVPSIIEDIIAKCENELCNLVLIRKNLESLLPQTMLMSSKALRTLPTA